MSGSALPSLELESEAAAMAAATEISRSSVPLEAVLLRAAAAAAAVGGVGAVSISLGQLDATWP